MTEDEEIDFLWSMALPYGSTGWKNSDCPVVRTTTKKVRAALQAAKKSIEWKGLKHCELAILAQAKYRKKERESGDRPPQPVGLSVWLNEERWTMMLEPEEEKEKLITYCQCGRPTHGPKFPECDICMTFKDGKMRGGMAKEMRLFHCMNKEVRTLKGRQDHINYMKSRIKHFGQGGVKKQENHVRDYYIYKYNL